MGVSFYSCDSCGESLYEEYVGHCIKCDSSLCTSCLINDDIKDRFAYKYGYVYDSNNPELMEQYKEAGFYLTKENGDPYYEDGDIIDDSGIAEKYCPFCSGNSINDDELLSYLLTKFNLDKEKEWKEYKSKK